MYPLGVGYQEASLRVPRLGGHRGRTGDASVVAVYSLTTKLRREDYPE